MLFFALQEADTLYREAVSKRKLALTDEALKKPDETSELEIHVKKKRRNSGHLAKKTENYVDLVPYDE